MEDFVAASRLICSGAGSNEDRGRAESCISGIIEQHGSASALLDMLYTVDDEIGFFISLAVQRIVWKRWFSLSEEERNKTATVYSQLLVEKGSTMQKFAQSKAEQVMAALCAQGGTLDYVINVLQQTGDSSRSVIGLSLLRTVLDEVLNFTDPRLSPQQQEMISNAAMAMVEPATTLACTVLQESATALHQAGTSLSAGGMDENAHKHAQSCLDTTLTALDALKVIIARINIGAHITPGVLDLLFHVAKMGVSGGGISIFDRCSVSALECLIELMAKRFVPVDPTGSSSVLLDMASKACALLAEYKKTGQDMLEESNVMLCLLEFVAGFCTVHLDRCMKQAAGQELVLQLIQELMELSRTSNNPEVMLKVARVWGDILEVCE